MERSKSVWFFSFFSFLFLAALLGSETRAEKLYYGVEMNGNLMGYMEVEIIPDSIEANGGTTIRSKMFGKLTLMGQPFDIELVQAVHMDSKTGKVFHYDSDISQGPMKLGSTAVVKDGDVHFTSKMGGKPKVIPLSPDVILDDSLTFPYLLKDFDGRKGVEKKYRVFDYTKGETHERTCTWVGAEKVNLAGEEFDCLVFSFLDHQIGVSGKVWLERETARYVKMESPIGAIIYRAEPAVVGQIKRAELDNTLFARVNVALADFQSVSYMKVKAAILTGGEWVTPESLNVPGQRFTGTVKDNFIDGVFEMEYKRYSGESAPPFPPSFHSEEELKKYLEPEDLIESDDPVLLEKAKEITAGSRDSWEAACRLSKWVAEEILYEIPGGSARKTFDSRKGECGSHSRLLAAFCRGMGIPARVASGCMYTPHYGGSFGQHAWNEIYMGEAGWIPVDSTAREIDYVDSGHIRIGSNAAFRPNKMEVLDYKAGSLEKGKSLSRAGAFENLPWEVGKTYSYRYLFDGTSIGTDSFTVVSFEKKNGTGVHTCRTELDLQGRSATGEWKIDCRGRPLKYEIKGQAGASEYSIQCDFSADKVVEKAVRLGNPMESTVSLPEEVYLVDNNNLSLFAFFLAALPMEKGKVFSFKIFHPSSMMVLPMQVTVEAKEQIPFDGKEWECWVCSVVLAGTPLKFWVDEKGRALKETEQSGRFVVEFLGEKKE